MLLNYTLIALGNAGFWVRKCVGTYSQLVYPRQVPHVLGRGVSTFVMFSQLKTHTDLAFMPWKKKTTDKSTNGHLSPHRNGQAKDKYGAYHMVQDSAMRSRTCVGTCTMFQGNLSRGCGIGSTDNPKPLRPM